MKILVCVKQVPDIDRIGVFEGADGEAVLEAVTEFRMNRYDEFAVEAALRIQETGGQGAPSRIDVLTVGPERSDEVVRRALGMGAHQGILLQADSETHLGPAPTAAAIARFAVTKGYDLILAGGMSEDGMHGMVGPLVAGHLDIPCAIHAVHLELVANGAAIRVEKELDGGVRERLQVKLPAVVTVQSGLNRPRYPALSKLLRANAQALTTIAMADLGPAPDHAAFTGMRLPPRARAARVLAGTPEEKASALVAVLKEKALL